MMACMYMRRWQWEWNLFSRLQINPLNHCQTYCRKWNIQKKKKKWNKGATVSSNIDNNISFQLNSNEIYKSPFCEEKVEKYRSLCHSIQSHLTLRLLSFSLSLIRRGNIYHIIEIFLTIHYANYLSNAHLYIYRDNNFS